MTSPKRLVDRLLLTALRRVPRRIAAHLMFLLRSHPEVADRWGYQVRGFHFYEPLPDFREITPESTLRRRVSPAINFNLPAQAALIQRLGAAYRAELEALAATPEPAGFNFRNDYFAGLDAAVYYALIRDLKPARVIEIGSGNSTRIADQALRRNRAEGRGGELICIEPYPEPRLTEAKLEMRLIQQRVELVDTAIFAALQPGDIFFIDSSHAVKFGSDVCHEFLEILPQLNPGVWVHVHDIFFPHDYPVDWLIEKRIAFNEQYLLEAFLSFNDTFSARIANYWLALEHPATAASLWPAFGQTFCPGALGAASFWMQKVH